jgi:hypothetical protein
MTKKDAKRFEPMWTTERDQWILYEANDPDGNFLGYAMRTIDGKRLRIEIDALYHYVIEQMLKAGVKVYTEKEWTAQLQAHIDEQKPQK